jgi:signal transduction histidine kinase
VIRGRGRADRQVSAECSTRCGGALTGCLVPTFGRRERTLSEELRLADWGWNAQASVRSFELLLVIPSELRELPPDDVVDVQQDNDLRARLRTAEHEVRELRERLADSEARVARLVDQYAAAERRFLERDRMAAVSGLFASAAHDIRSPLMALVCNQRILEELVGGSDLANNTTVHAIFEDDRIARDNIEGVLTSLRAYATGQGDACLLSVRHIVESTLRLFRWHNSQRGVRFESQIEGDPVGWGMPSEVCQIIMNLLSNAVDASPWNGVVRVEVRQGENAAIVRVSDQGEPIAPEDAELAFLPFTTRSRDGTGVGLAVARSMARRYKGDVRVDAECPDGTCFELRLTATPPQSP